MSNQQMRGSGRARSPSRSNAPARGRGNPRSGQPKGGPRAGNSSRVDRVWGHTPASATDSRGLTRLFEEQKRLSVALLRQAKLAKLAMSEIRSTEAERMRMVNQAILDVSSGIPGAINPFEHRNLIDSQILSERMIRTQGQRTIQGSPWKPTPPAGPNAIRIRTKRVVTDDRCRDTAALEDLLSLRGPLARTFRRAVERGYQGTPRRWLRSPVAVREITKLQQKGFTFHSTEFSVVSPSSPLFFAVNGSSGIEHHSRTSGFRGETIRRKATNFVVLRRQSSSVARLKRSQWPNSGHGWPTYPTLNESWASVVTGKFPLHLQKGFSSTTRLTKIRPTKLVKPGTMERALSYYVIGIRADIEVPRKLLGYFKYRWGFLILKRHGHYNRTLCKFLAKVWKSDHTGMFLREPIRLSEALRCVPASKLSLLGGFIRGGPDPSGKPHRVRARPSRSSRCLRTESVEISQRLKSAPSSDKSDGGVRLY